MSITDYQAKYLAYELTKRCPSDSLEKLASAVAGAQVDLNPHQVDAALFTFRSPLSKGAILADEVGLGKTIEAGLVISQKWAERKRRILIITPSNLRKQWHQEMNEKFFLPCAILETKSYNAAIKAGTFSPFEPKEEAVVICSYQFARNKAADVHRTPWDLVVIDEAHRLRNVYKPSNIIANVLKGALQERHKLLLTATPLQNSLLELFGLVSIIDDHSFGDLRSFREQFANLSQQQVFDTLKARLKPICHRTLRRQVTQYVPFTKRHAMVEPFDPGEGEDKLYHLVSDYLRRDNLQALPPSQRSLMTLVLRKLLASSSFAIAGALTSISKRLKAQLKADEPKLTLEDELDEDYESLDETAEEWGDDPHQPLSAEDRVAIAAESADLDEFARLALSLDHNAKGKALLKALDVAFAKARELGAAEKAIIFTESRKTQSYLLRLLGDSPWAEGIVLFNGSIRLRKTSSTKPRPATCPSPRSSSAMPITTARSAFLSLFWENPEPSPCRCLRWNPWIKQRITSSSQPAPMRKRFWTKNRPAACSRCLPTPQMPFSTCPLQKSSVTSSPLAKRKSSARSPSETPSSTKPRPPS